MLRHYDTIGLASATQEDLGPFVGPMYPPIMRHLAAEGVTPTGIPSPSVSPAPPTSRLAARARRKQHRCHIDAA
jgi:hypothetical protein